jgi:type IV secretory pathway TraG/TraD family ATPase VirD4
MQSIALLIFFFFMMFLLIELLSRILHFSPKMQRVLIFEVFKIIFYPFKKILGAIFGIYKYEGFASWFDKRNIFNSSNQGFVIDGENKRLSKKASFQNVLITGVTGLGKSTIYIYASIFSLAKNRHKNSLIINDPKSEFINRTSGYLKKHSYEVYSLNPLNLNQSIYYNPLVNIKDDSDIDQLVRIIINSSYSDAVKSDDIFWQRGGQELLFVIIHCLINTKNSEITNLPNVLHTLNNFGDQGKGIDSFVSQYASPKVYNMWLGIINSNPNVLLSFLSTARNALTSLGVNQNVEKLLSQNTFNFQDIREKKIAIFINIAPQHEPMLGFISDMFYTQMFEALTPIPTKDKCDVFALLDEIGNYKISKLPTYVTFLRASRIAFLLLIQDFHQLKVKYGANNANVIADGGVGTKIYFSNSGVETATHISKRIGNKKVYQSNGSFVKDEIMGINEIITMKDNEVLVFHSNKKPIKLKVKKYFEVPKYKRYSKLRPHITVNNNHIHKVQYIDFRSSI